EEHERVAGALEVAIERRELLRHVVLLRARDHQHRRPDRNLLAEEGDGNHLVVLLLEEDARRGVAARPVVARRVALPVPGHPRAGLRWLPVTWGPAANSVFSRGFEDPPRRPSVSTTGAA